MTSQQAERDADFFFAVCAAARKLTLPDSAPIASSVRILKTLSTIEDVPFEPAPEFFLRWSLQLLRPDPMKLLDFVEGSLEQMQGALDETTRNLLESQRHRAQIVAFVKEIEAFVGDQKNALVKKATASWEEINIHDDAGLAATAVHLERTIAMLDTIRARIVADPSLVPSFHVSEEYLSVFRARSVAKTDEASLS
jgi:hypothetical protein